MAPLSSFLSILGALVALELTLTAASNKADQQPQKPLLSSDHVCQHPPYKVTMVSKSPLVIYIKDFITPEERAHLLNITKDTFTRSGVTSKGKGGPKEDHRSSLRTSQSTSVRPDPIVKCIESRALNFQGYDIPPSHLEPLQLVKYAATEHYHYHTDWFTSPAHSSPSLGGNRVSSFFAYIHVANDTTGGGTNFPRLDPPENERWCEEGIVDCDEAYEKGVTFLPVEGNAIYWENLLPDGRGDERTLHAGLPVRGGGKVGMNIWTRQGDVPGYLRGV
ncbi:putative prolyl 4-hydroxylase 4 [Rhypophila decipiens]|uniref:Prolyl 4-hydroxylase 4 n=1 Tax=Rhypophila decipiens TaxID=261697 RepID=A0AAN6Y922_9PEZI|nr:putative prolyl 4-hydroxylase 4 [Rhypophila decipiens]